MELLKTTEQDKKKTAREGLAKTGFYSVPQKKLRNEGNIPEHKTKAS